MRKIFLFALALCVTAVWLISCGSSSKKIIVPAQTSAFSFLQSTSQSGMFAPVLGKFVTTGGNTQFTATQIVDPSTKQPVTAAFYSMILNNAGDKVTFDLNGGLDGTSGQWDIWVGKADGTGLVQVTNDSYDDAMPQFSPDGTKVVFISYRGGGPQNSTGEVVIRNVDGTNEQDLPIPQYVWDMWAPTYSPDGTKIAMYAWGYDATNTEFAGIMVMDAAHGSNAKLLTDPFSADCFCWDTNPSFTADGTKIAFQRTNYTSSPHIADIYVMNADGTGAAKLTDSVGVNSDPLMLTIAGVGERILFASNRDNLTADGNGFEIYSMKTDGSGITRLTNNTLFDGFCTAWSGSSDSAESVGSALHMQRNVLPPAHGLRW